MIQKTLLFGVLASLALSCSKSKPTPHEEPPTATSAPSLAASASAAANPIQAPKNAIPTLVLDEPLEGTKGYSFYPIEGAFLVVDGLRVGRYVDGKVEWIGTLPEFNQSLNGSRITEVTGVWPEVDVHFTSNQGRALQPSVYPLTGKGNMIMFGEGGATAWLFGTVRFGKTTFVAGIEQGLGSRFAILRGPAVLIRKTDIDKAGCDADKVRSVDALSLRAVAATGKGTLITVGNLCDDDQRPAAEIWEEPGKSRIVELKHLLPKLNYFPRMLAGKGDELWIESKGILHYLDGKFETLPLPTHALKGLFVSASGKLHGIANRELVRYDDGKWTPIATVPRAAQSYRMTMDEAGTLWAAKGGIAKFREARGNEAEPPCTTPFVYLFDVAWGNENKFTFPTTRKALATFPDVTNIKLMEYRDSWARKLGVQVESEAQAEALVKHVKETMKDELPEIVCDSPQNPRIIDINTGK